jgi:adenylate cyclase
VQLDPLSAEAHVGVANAAVLTGDFAAADAAFERAEALNPGLFEAWYHHARSCAMRGNHARAVDLYERAALARPGDHEALNMAAQSYLSLGRRNEARHASQRSIVNAERVLSLQPNDVRALSLACGAFAQLGRADEARRCIERATNLEPDESYVRYCAACAYATLGDIENALDSLEKMGIENMANRSWMENDCTLDPLRGHPRFEALRALAR